MEKLKRVIRKEEFISRLPALFAYIEDNALGESVLHSAYDANMGCYGKVVENIQLPMDAIDNGGTTLLTAGRSYSYRTIMDCYYNYHSELNEGFLDFVDCAIGRIKVTGDWITDDTDLVPEYIHLATVHSLYNEMVKMQKECEFYECRKPIDGDDAYMCCLCEKYARMGGEDMVKFLSEYIDVAKTRADEYLGYAKAAQDAESFVSATMGIQLTSSVNDLGIRKPQIIQWVAGDTYYSGDIVYYDGNAYECKYDSKGEPTTTNGKYNPNTELIEFDSEAFELLEPSKADGVTIEGYADSKLQSLRRYTNYFNEYGEEETPSDGEDWLFYYRKGEIVNIETLNDEHGNIMRYVEPSDRQINEVIDPYKNDGSDYIKGEIAPYLFAYGDVLYNIEANKDSTITFTYYIGVHLTATYVESDVDDDGNYHYYFSDFQPDLEEANNKHIIEYKETYSYESDGDLAELISTEVEVWVSEKTYEKMTQFEAYISGYYDYGGNVYKEIEEKKEEKISGLIDTVSTIMKTKYEFNTSNNLVYYDKTVRDQVVTLSTNITDFTSSNGATVYKDEYEIPLTKDEYYSGVSYAPTEDIDVYISRGATTAFEKFIKFSEVKTLDAMERYSNGSFFKMMSDS